MDIGTTNPFGMLTFIVAPAILTNASSVMSLGTGNRFARVIDRIRALSAMVEGKEASTDPEIELRRTQLRLSRRRAIFIARALTAFYLAVGSFGAASLISIFGAAFVVVQRELLWQTTLVLAVLAGFTGVAGLVCGTSLLVWESRLTLYALGLEVDFMLRQQQRDVVP